MSEDEFDFSGRDWRDLSPQQWTEARRGIYCRAHRMRSEAALALGRYFFAGIASAWRLVCTRYARLETARNEREAIARLQALDDRTLNDLGIRRSEIESVVHANGRDATRRRNCSLAA